MMGTISILVGLFIIWAIWKKGFQLLGGLWAILEKPVGYVLWGVIIFVVISWFF